MYTDEATTTDLSLVELEQTYEGVISNTATALTDDVYVKIPQLDGEDPKGIHKHGPCRWSPRPGAAAGSAPVYPAVGNTALVVVSDLGNYWILEFWPYA